MRAALLTLALALAAPTALAQDAGPESRPDQTTDQGRDDAPEDDRGEEDEEGDCENPEDDPPETPPDPEEKPPVKEAPASNAEKFYEDAQYMNQVLTNYGFRTDLWTNHVGAAEPWFDRDILTGAVISEALWFWTHPAPDDELNEYFLYYGGHGGPGVLSTEPPRGNSDLPEADLWSTLGLFPDDVVITILIDACYSGSFTDDPQTLDGLLAGNGGNLAGLTIMTSTSAALTCPVGDIVTDSATEDFADGDWWEEADSIDDHYANMEEDGVGVTLYQEGEPPPSW